MRKYQNRHVMLAIDFDNDLNRREFVVSQIPQDLRDRFYLLGCSDEPESLLAALGTKHEALGELLALDCDRNTNTTWSHAMLAHNVSEIERLKINVKPFLFSQG
jgi:hypothetical protein